MADVVGTPCFISYAHADDDQFGGVVERFRRDLASYYQAITGKTLSIFRDRDDIGWGEDWREKIRSSVQGATVFIPMVTMRYFDSEACSEELLAFYNNARQLGVTELLLPVVILGARAISSMDPREEVRLIEALQYVPITEAWMAGFDSSEWRTLMISLVERLERALASAEPALATASAAISHDDADVTDDQADLMAVMAAAEEITPLLGEALEEVQRFIEAASDLFAGQTRGLSAGQMNARILAGSARIAPVAKDLESKGTDVLSRISVMDANIRGTVTELRSIQGDFSSQLLDSLLGPQLRLENVEESLQTIDQVVQALKGASVLSSTLRKAIRPATNGIQALRTAVATFGSWADL